MAEKARAAEKARFIAPLDRGRGPDVTKTAIQSAFPMADFTTADGPHLEAILDATYEIWHEGLSRTAYGRYYQAQVATPWGRRNLTRLALVEGGEVVASGKLYMFGATLD